MGEYRGPCSWLVSTGGSEAVPLFCHFLHSHLLAVDDFTFIFNRQPAAVR